MKTNIILSSVSLMLLPAVTPCFAAIEPIAPGGGEMVAPGRAEEGDVPADA